MDSNSNIINKKISFELIISLVFAAMYFLLQTNLHTYDSIDYTALAISDMPLERHFHSHHLLYHLILRAIALLSKNVTWVSGDPFALLGFPAALFGGLSVGRIFYLARKVLPHFPSLIISLGSGFSYSFVFMSTEVEKYPIALFFILQSIVSFEIHSRKISHTQIVKSAVWLSFAVLVHQISILIVLAFTSLLLFFKNELRIVKRFQLIVLFGLIISIITGIAYFTVTVIVKDLNWSDSFQWMFAYASTGKWGNGFQTNPQTWFDGHLRSLIGNPVYRTLTCFKTIPWLLVFTVFYGSLWAIAAMAIWFHRSSYRSSSFFYFFWFISFTIFIIWWEPYNTKVAMLMIPSLWLFWSYSLIASKRIIHYFAFSILLIFVTLIAYNNLTRGYYYHLPGADFNRAVASVIKKNTQPDSLIVVPYNSTIDRYLINFLDRKHAFSLESLCQHVSSVEELETIIDNSLKKLCSIDHPIYICGRVFIPVGKNPSAIISNDDVAEIMLDYFAFVELITELPNDDKLYVLNKWKLCENNELMVGGGS